MKYLIILSILFSFMISVAQESLNRIDDNGLRQGLWEKSYPNGKSMYKGNFRDNKPIGEWIRYHENGKVQAMINYSGQNDSAFAQLFDISGKKIAEGIYLNKEKVGTWSFFSDKRLTSETNFLNGVKHGISKNYYKTGELFEESIWNEGNQEGLYKAYYTNGEIFMECIYKKGKREGKCRTYYPNGTIEMNGNYVENDRDGDWTFLNQQGEILYVLKYKNGKLLNPAVLDSIQTSKLNNLDKNKDKLIDPEKFIQNPDEFLNQNRMQR